MRCSDPPLPEGATRAPNGWRARKSPSALAALFVVSCVLALSPSAFSADDAAGTRGTTEQAAASTDDAAPVLPAEPSTAQPPAETGAPVLDPPVFGPSTPRMPPPPTVAAPQLAWAVAASHTLAVRSAGRHGAGLLLADGGYTIVPSSLVEVGWPAEIDTQDGKSTRGFRVLVRGSLTLLRLDPPLPGVEPPPIASFPAPLDAAWILGHGNGSAADATEGVDLLSGWSVLSARVASAPLEVEEGGPTWPSFLLDRPVADGDLGAPVFNDEGHLLGIVVERAAARTRVAASSVILELLSEERPERDLDRASHFTLTGGVAIHAQGAPTLLGGSLLLTGRIAIADVIRLEPWLSLGVAARGPRGEGAAARPSEQGVLLDAGFSFGPRIPVFGGGRRSYLVPSIGAQLSVGRFSHEVHDVVLECPSGQACAARVVDRTNSDGTTAFGFDLGFDIQRGPLRIGYRAFVDPVAPLGSLVHRLVVTVDGLPFPVRHGPS